MIQCPAHLTSNYSTSPLLKWLFGVIIQKMYVAKQCQSATVIQWQCEVVICGQIALYAIYMNHLRQFKHLSSKQLSFVLGTCDTKIPSCECLNLCEYVFLATSWLQFDIDTLFILMKKTFSPSSVSLRNPAASEEESGFWRRPKRHGHLMCHARRGTLKLQRAQMFSSVLLSSSAPCMSTFPNAQPHRWVGLPYLLLDRIIECKLWSNCRQC